MARITKKEPVRKKFFQNASATQILNLPTTDVSDNVLDAIVNMSENEAIVIQKEIYPIDEYIRESDDLSIDQRIERAGKAFLKKGPAVFAPEACYDKHAKEILRPVNFRRTAVNISMHPGHPYAGFTFKSFDEEDRMTRRTNLVDCLEGLRIYCYVRGPQSENKSVPVVDVELHGTPSTRGKKNPIPSGARRDGVSVEVTIPGRNIGQNRYNMIINSIPVFDNENKLKIAYRLNTTHSCGSKKYTQMRYMHETSDERSQMVYFCAHDVAGILFATEFLHTEFGLTVPHQMNPLIIPSQELVDLYTKLNNNCAIQIRDRPSRELHKAEKEGLLWLFSRKFGHDKTCKPETGSKLKDYNWHVDR